VQLETLFTGIGGQRVQLAYPRRLIPADDLPRTEATGKVQCARLLAKVSA
jgi:hypothetical protein